MGLEGWLVSMWSRLKSVVQPSHDYSTLSQQSAQDLHNGQDGPAVSWGLGGLASLLLVRKRQTCAFLCGTGLIFIIASTWLLHDSRDGGIPPSPQAPMAKKIPSSFMLHGTEITDDYTWLRNMSDPDVLTYVDAENTFTDESMVGLSNLQAQLVVELNEYDTSHVVSPCSIWNKGVQSFWETGAYFYYVDYGRTYPAYFRRRRKPEKGTCGCFPDSPDELVLDYNAFIPKRTPFFKEGVFEVNPHDENLVAYSFDTHGSEEYELHILNITSRLPLGPPDGISRSYYSVRWSPGINSSYVYYNVVGPVWGIPRSIYRFCVTNCPDGKSGPSELVYTEADVTLTTEVKSFTDNSQLFINVQGQVTSELLLLASDSPPKPLFTRVSGHQYTADRSNDGYLYVRTDAGGAPEFHILRVHETKLPTGPLTIAQFVELTDAERVAPHVPGGFIEKFEIYSQYLVLWIRKEALRTLQYISLTALPKHVQFEVSGGRQQLQTYSIFPGTASDMDDRTYPWFDNPCFYFTNSSFLTPRGTYGLRFDTNEIKLVVTELHAKLPGTYTERRLWAPSTSTANTLIPISLVAPLDNPHTSNKPLLLRAYGAYGGYQDPFYDDTLFPLLARGMGFAICHPRGDGDLGAGWYTAAKYETKAQTFQDVRDCMAYLVHKGWSSPGQMALYGRSAGGLIAGTAVNQWGDMLAAVVAQVPFVDPVADMSDDTVPWTAYEYFEWGNPVTSPKIFRAMLDYSPYANIPSSSQPHLPSLFVTAGLHDSRVGFYEPLKWVAKLRTIHAQVLARITTSGHFGGGGSSGYREKAEWYAFLIDRLGAGLGVDA